MPSFRLVPGIAGLLALAAGQFVAGPPQASADPPAPAPSWTADNGNGTYSNPLFYEEFEDPDIIRVGEDYYLAGTTMHMNPGLVVMHSRDLVNWKLASYCIDRLDLGPRFRLEGGTVYGQGIWAPCIRYHDGTFYIFSNVNGVGTQVFRSPSPHGPWARNQLPGMHDLSVLFDDDGKVYAIYGAGRPTIVELNQELTEVLPNSRRPMDAPGLGEGHHLYKIKGQYYDVSAIPGGHTDQVVARAASLDGPWQVERMVQSESLGVPTQNGLRASGRGDERTFTITPSDPNAGGGLTLHQGGIVDTPSGQWWSVIMQDHGSIGRLVALVPVTWDNEFPLIGLPGNLRKAPNTWVKPDTGHLQKPQPAFVRSDHFDASQLNPVWQWNHVPDDTRWSLSDKPGVLRLHSLPAADFWMARNSLTQRPLGPECVATVELDASGLAAGDTAGLALLNSPYAWIGLVKTADGVTLQTFDQTNRRTATAAAAPTRVWLRVACNFDAEQAVFGWSPDGQAFAPLGEPFSMVFQLTTFQGVRLALFNYNTAGQPGGFADFDNFILDEPRAAGIERMIPVGKTITLASGADGSLLTAGSQDASLVNVPADSPLAATPAVRFQVLDLGRGRVAFRANDGRLVSVRDGGVVLKDAAGAAPGQAESFQWINLMRGDTMFMSLVDHRYLATQPHRPGPVSVSATGPRPDRQGGACFRWREVAAGSAGQPAGEAPAADPAAAASLRQAAQGLFDIGVGIHDGIAGRVADHRLLLAQFNAVTPENCMKPAKIQAAEGQWDFAQADGFVDFAAQHGLQIVGHCLVWAKDDRTPAWFYRDGDGPASRELLLERMRRHIETEVTRYRGRIATWDVVNEALDDGAEYLRVSGWSKACGEEFIAKAFEYAHAADPAALLVYNDYNNELPAKREKQIRLLRSLLDQKVPVHAVGLQGHYEIDRVPFQDIEDTLQAMRQLGIKVVISELDIDIIPRGKWWADGGKYREELAQLDPYRDGCPPEVLQRQADQYAQLFRLFRRYSDTIARISFWNLHDGQSWLNDFPWKRANHPLLFDRQGHPKPAFTAVLSALKEP